MRYLLVVTNDEYELPVVCAESIPEMAKTLGITRNAVQHRLIRSKRPGYQGTHKMLWTEDDDEQDCNG